MRPAILERRIHRGRPTAVPFPDRHLTRSSYEQVFLRLVAGTAITLGGRVYRPTKMRGWYHAAFEGANEAEERLFSIGELLSPDVRWLESASSADRE